MQRENLTPLDEAQAYRQLIDDFGRTQEETARTVGKSRSHIANLLRLLSLPDAVQKMVGDGRLSAGHARALIITEAPLVWAKLVVARGLSVRQTEHLVKKKTSKPAPAVRDPNIVALENDVSQLLGLKVLIKTKGEGGTLEIAYETLEQLDDVLHRLTQGSLLGG